MRRLDRFEYEKKGLLYQLKTPAEAAPEQAAEAAAAAKEADDAPSRN